MSLKDQPLLEHFGNLPSKPLSNTEAQHADFETRIASIGRFLVREVLKLWGRLSPEGKATYEAEDLFLEIWMELEKRNNKYDANRGNYRTFANKIMCNKFNEIIKRSRCVKLPADADKQFKTGNPEKIDRLSRTATDHEPLTTVLVQDRQPSPIDGLIWLEEHEKAVADVANHIGNMTSIEAIAIKTIGIWGPASTIQEAAATYGLAPKILRRALVSAKSKLESK